MLVEAPVLDRDGRPRDPRRDRRRAGRPAGCARPGSRRAASRRRRRRRCSHRSRQAPGRRDRRTSPARTPRRRSRAPPTASDGGEDRRAPSATERRRRRRRRAERWGRTPRSAIRRRPGRHRTRVAAGRLRRGRRPAVGDIIAVPVRARERTLWPVARALSPQPRWRSGCSRSPSCSSARSTSTPTQRLGHGGRRTIPAWSSTSGPAGTPSGPRASRRAATAGRPRPLPSTPSAAAVAAVGRLLGRPVPAGRRARVADGRLGGGRRAVPPRRGTARRAGARGVPCCTCACSPPRSSSAPPYSESLFLALAVATFLLAERGRLGWAACTVGLALLTRPQGAALLAALAVLLWQRRGARGPRRCSRSRSGSSRSIRSPSGVWIGRPSRSSTRRASGSGRSARSDRSGASRRRCTRLTGSSSRSWWRSSRSPSLAWRMLGTAYGVYAVSALVIPMSVPSARLGGLYSFPRFAIVAFPASSCSAPRARGCRCTWPSSRSRSPGSAST